MTRSEYLASLTDDQRQQLGQRLRDKGSGRELFVASMPFESLRQDDRIDPA